MPDKPQSFENHGRILPWYHYFVFGILTLNLSWVAYRMVITHSIESAIALLMAVALIVLAIYARSFALRAQDRVIRLEMRLRMQDILPPELRARIRDLTPRQLIALRFASDAELPELTAAVLRDNIQSGRQIKKMIRDWQGDYLRV